MAAFIGSVLQMSKTYVGFVLLAPQPADWHFCVVAGIAPWMSSDNISSILLTKNLVFHACTKHIDVYYHFVYEKIVEDLLDLRHVRIEDQVVDIFMKPLTKEKFFKFIRKIGL